MLKTPWAIKYRPSKIENYIFQNENHKTIFENFIREGTIPNLLFIGHQGTGKTTLARAMKTELHVEDSDFLFIHASDENSVDTIRYKVNSFIRTIPDGQFKLVVMDEADRLSPEALDIFKGILEDEYVLANARFIFTANTSRRFSGPFR